MFKPELLSIIVCCCRASNAFLTFYTTSRDIVSLREEEVGWVKRFINMKLFRNKYKVGFVELGLVELLIFLVGLWYRIVGG